MTTSIPMRPIFIGACPRSGTTFLGDRLGALLAGRVLPESQFKRPVLRAFLQKGPEAALAALDQERSYQLWRNRPPRAALQACTDARQFMTHLVFPDGVPTDAPAIWIDHTPVNFEDFQMLRQVFPEARFVNLVRDGRAVFASVRGLEWGPSNPIHASRWWAARSAPGLAAGLTFPDQCLTARYEDLARGDLTAWSRLLGFLTEDPNRTVTQDELMAESGFALPDFTRHQHQMVGQAPSAASTDRWRIALTPRDIEIFEAGTGGALLETLGYDRVFPQARAARRNERIRMGEWPVRITMEPVKQVKQALRWSRVKSTSLAGAA